MSSVFNISLSGMNAAQTALSASASNIAKAGTERLRRQHAQESSLSARGVTAVVVQGDPTAGDGLVTDVVDMLQTRNSFLANLAVFKTGSKMTGALMDIST